MAEETKPQAKPEAKAEVKKPTAKKASNGLNKDGVPAGKPLSQDEYWALINKQKAKK